MMPPLVHTNGNGTYVIADGVHRLHLLPYAGAQGGLLLREPHTKRPLSVFLKSLLPNQGFFYTSCRNFQFQHIAFYCDSIIMFIIGCGCASRTSTKGEVLWAGVAKET